MSSPNPSKRYSRRAQILMIGLMACLVAGATIAVQILNQSEAPVENTAKTTDSFKPTPEQWIGLKIEPVTSETFHATETTDGKIALNDDATTPVFSPYSGRVTKLIAKPGDVVKQGDPLFAIEATELAQAQNDLISAAASVNTAAAQLKVAETTEKRQHELYEAQGGALKLWQQSVADLAAAKETLRSDGIALAAARNRLHILGKSNEDVAAIENSPDAQKLSAETVVDAPIDGTIIQRQISPGQNIQAGAANPVYTIGNLSTVWLLANVRETDAPFIQVGAPVEVHILALPEHPFKAKLTYVAATIDPNTHRLAVRAEVENTDGVLKPEMFASFNVTTGNDVSAPAVPDSAVVYEGDQAHVWLAHDDKTVSLRNIHIGHVESGMDEVTDGLTNGDKIVTSGALFIDRAAAGD